jgi:imidazolonepropionase-like amidohydrolase
LGRIRPGFEADLIAVESDPALDVAKLRTVSFVMKGGAIVVDRAVTDRGQQPPK